MNSTSDKKRVLMVDDNLEVLRFLEIYLKTHGFEVITTTSGEESLNLVKSCSPDIILLDIIMPGIDGFEVLRRLRAFSRIPVIVFSSSSGTYSQAMHLGADDFIPKPFQPDEIISKIKALLSVEKIS
jgi:two-component system, OmpR family, KDP operon response regulator KdpE